MLAAMKPRPSLRRWISLCLLSCGCLAAAAASTDYAHHIADLISPAKLATLGSRKANPRVQKAVAQLEAAKRDGLKVEMVASNAVVIARYTNAAAAKLTREALVRSYYQPRGQPGLLPRIA